MIRQKTKGVSPVIGVILMVAITVIIAAVVANFVLGLAGNLEQDADATVTTSQEVAAFSNSTYNVSVVVSQMDNADYLVVKEQTEARDVSTSYSGAQPSDNNVSAPTAAGDSASATDDAKAGILVSAGDEATVQYAQAGDDIQIFGALDGSENLITTYEVENTLGA